MYLSEMDIGNRALQHCGHPRMNSPTEDTSARSEVSFVYDKLRLAELRRNVWRFSIRNCVLRAIDPDTLLLSPRAWDATVTYPPAAIVKDENGILWQSTVAGNIGNDPVETAAWDRYFGPMTVHLYDEDTSYYAGELVYAEAGNPGSYAVFRSLVNGNEDDPETGTAWDDEVTYREGQTVSYGGFQWRSLIEVNRNITPATPPLDYDAGSAYSVGQQVVASDGYIYTATGNTQGDDPVTDGGVNWTNTTVPAAWKKVPTIYASSIKWQPIFASLTNILFTYPIGVGPGYSSTTRNAMRLPAGFVREAHPAPAQGGLTYVGGPGALPASDLQLEGKFFLTNQPVLPFRFAADISDVSEFDPMFCEGFAARIALAVCEPLTQSSSKLGGIASQYQNFMKEARTVNAIEKKSEQAEEDELVAVRA